MHTKAQIVEMVMTRNLALARALVALNLRQTADEQTSEATKYSNQRGFNAAHAKRGTSMAQFFLRTGFLTPKQMAWWRAPARPGGAARIAMYAGQLVEIAAERAASAGSATDQQRFAAQESDRVEQAERAADKAALAALEAEQEQAAFVYKLMHRP